MKATINRIAVLMLATTAICLTAQLFAEEPAAESEDTAELAKKLANPIESLISVPLQYNFNHNLGAENKGHKNRFLFKS